MKLPKAWVEVFGPVLLSCVVILALSSPVWFSGCATLAPGADPLVVRVEQIQAGADATVDMVLNLDNSDRGFWKTNAPAFHNFCSYLRAKIPVSPTHNSPRVLAIEQNVHQLKLNYKANKTAGNSNLLYQAASELGVLVSQSASWSNIITAPTPH